ncbi:MAG: lipoate--protein ligase family protein [Chlamydiota bacterium]
MSTQSSTPKRPPLHILRLEQAPIFRQLQIEEALLRLTEKNWCILNEGSCPAIVFGISGKPAEHLATISSMPLIRRYSGGGTVVVDENTLFVSLILQKQDFSSSCYPEPILRWAETIYKEAFAITDFKLRENDYVIGLRKCGGNAQYIQKHRFVCHTTFLWDYSKARMRTLLVPQKTPAYRHQRSHEDFLCCLKDYASSKQQLFESLPPVLSKYYTVQEAPPVDKLLSIEHRRATKLLTQVRPL